MIYTNLNFRILSEEAIEALLEVIGETVNDVEFDGAAAFAIEGTGAFAVEDDVKEFAINMANSVPESAFEIDGYIDTSELAGELMDFSVRYADYTLTLQFSDWYIEAYMGDFEDYDSFCEDFHECSAEEYDNLKNEEFVYLIETDNGDVLSKNVPMNEPEIVIIGR